MCRETMIIHYLEFAAKVKSERNGTAKHQKRSPAIIYVIIGVALAIIEDCPRPGYMQALDGMSPRNV